MRVYADESKTTKANFLSKHHQLRRQSFTGNLIRSLTNEHNLRRFLRPGMSYLNLLLGRLHMLARAVVTNKTTFQPP